MMCNVSVSYACNKSIHIGGVMMCNVSLFHTIVISL